MSEIEVRLAAEEAAPMSDEEKKYYQAALEALPEPERAHFAEDKEGVMLIVRGFANEKDRMAATTDAIKMISEWRERTGFYGDFDRPMQGAEDFHKWWPERIHGTDKLGHVVQSLRIEELDPEKIASLSDENIDRFQGQRLKAYTHYKQEKAKQSGVQRYKHTLIIDLKGVGMGLLAGQKRHTVKKIFHVGSTYFPETMWRIYLVNPPMVFRAVWSVVKNFLHPVTVNKIQFCGGNKDACKKMQDESIPLEAIPEWMGGGNKGVAAFDYIQHLTAAKN